MLGPKGRALRGSGQPARLSLRKPNQKNVNKRQRGEYETHGGPARLAEKPERYKRKTPYAVRKVGTQYTLPDVPAPPGF